MRSDFNASPTPPSKGSPTNQDMNRGSFVISHEPGKQRPENVLVFTEVFRNDEYVHSPACASSSRHPFKVSMSSIQPLA